MTKEKYGFIYIWYDRKHKRFYIGSHWGKEEDNYICSSRWMRRSYKSRPTDFRRRIIAKVYTNRSDLLDEEQRWLNMIKDSELTPFNTSIDSRVKNVRYYNVSKIVKQAWHSDAEQIKEIGQKISAAKKGKKTGPQPQRGPAISAAKKGKSFTEEHKAALSKAAKTRKRISAEDRAKKSDSLKAQWAPGGKRREALNIS